MNQRVLHLDDRILEGRGWTWIRRDADARVLLVSEFRETPESMFVVARLAQRAKGILLDGALSVPLEHLTSDLRVRERPAHLQDRLLFHGEGRAGATTSDERSYHERQHHVAVTAIALELLLEFATSVDGTWLVITRSPEVGTALSRLCEMKQIGHMHLVPENSQAAGGAAPFARRSLRVAAVSEILYPASVDRLTRLREQLEQCDADVLVLAGNIADSFEHLGKALELFSCFSGRKLFVPGNHEYFDVPRSPFERFRQHILCSGPFEHADRRIVDVLERHAVVPLWRGPVQVQDQTFVGSTLWYDYSFNNSNTQLVTLPDGEVAFSRLPQQMYIEGTMEHIEGRLLKRVCWPDKQRIRGRWDDGAVCGRMHAVLRAQLQSASGVTGSVVLVTHMLPWIELSQTHPDASSNFANAFTGTLRTAEVIEAPSHRVTHVLHGRRHQRGATMVRGIPTHGVAWDPAARGLPVITMSA